MENTSLRAFLNTVSGQNFLGGSPKYHVRELPHTYVIEYKDSHGRDTFVCGSDNCTVLMFSTRAEANQMVSLLNEDARESNPETV